MVTHRLAEARAWSDSTIMLDAGRVVEHGPTAALFAAPREERTRAFIRSAP
jgi:polar amino acid transport system ATP-binding protein